MLLILKRLLGVSSGLITEPARGEHDSTAKQIDFLRKLGYEGTNLSKFDATLLITRILRPVDYAISHTFKKSSELAKEQLRTLQIALAHEPYIKSFPRYGPYRDWDDINKKGDGDNPLTKEQRVQVTDTAVCVLPPAVFLSLPSNGVKKYKDLLDARIRTKA